MNKVGVNLQFFGWEKVKWIKEKDESWLALKSFFLLPHAIDAVLSFVCLGQSAATSVRTARPLIRHAQEETKHCRLLGCHKSLKSASHHQRGNSLTAGRDMSRCALLREWFLVFGGPRVSAEEDGMDKDVWERGDDQIDDDRKANKPKSIHRSSRHVVRHPPRWALADEKAAVRSEERWKTAVLELNATSSLQYVKSQQLTQI